MVATSDPVSITILILLMFISFILIAYVSFFVYARYKQSKGEKYQTIDFFQPSFLDSERKPLIPGDVHTRTIQPVLSNDVETDEEEDSMDEVDNNFKERDYSKLGRIIFVMRYHKKREELMVRLVQIEGLPVSQELYSPNSAYVDVQLKYTGTSASRDDDEVQRPPRLDICLQQVYYFIISTQQMMSHSLEFQINTFDDQFRRFVSGVVEVNLYKELGEDILTGNEVVFVKDILEPFKFSEEQRLEEDDFVSAVSEIEEENKAKEKEVQEEEQRQQQQYQQEETIKSRGSSLSSSRDSISSKMSWEPEVSQDLLSISMGSLFQRSSSVQDLSLNPLTEYKRAHSIGYLPTYEWTVKDIPLDEEEPYNNISDNNTTTTNNHNTDYYKLYDDIPDESPLERPSDLNFEKINIKPPPESFYRIVPITPLLPETEPSNATPRRVAYKKHQKRKNVGRSMSTTKRSPAKQPKVKKLQRSLSALDRSSSWPSLPSTSPNAPVEHASSNEVPRPIRHFFQESSI